MISQQQSKLEPPNYVQRLTLAKPCIAMFLQSQGPNSISQGQKVSEAILACGNFITRAMSHFRIE